MPLSDIQIDRYSRQIILPEIGGRGQERLLESAVAVVGTEEPAIVATRYLAAAGIGRLVIHNLAGETAASMRLRDEVADLNPDVRLEVLALAPGTVSGAIWAAGCDVMVTATGDVQVLRRIVPAAVEAQRPLVAGGVVGSLGWLGVADGRRTAAPCVCCAALSASAVPTTAEETPLGPIVAGVVGSLMSLEVLKLRLGVGQSGYGTWLQFDVEASTLEQWPIVLRDDCPVCAETVAQA